MKSCPRCTYPLEVEVLREIELDHCRRCGGTYLCPEKGPQVFGPFVDPALWAESGISRFTGEEMLQCPTDHHTLKVYEVSFGDETVEIDLCSECRGIWIDSEEGKELREIVMKAGQVEETGLAAKDARSGPLGYIFQLISSFPLEVWNPIHSRPRATLGLIGILSLVFVIQLADSGGAFTAALELVPAQIMMAQRLWTIITALFLHGHILHLAGNLYFLYVFGDNVEDYLGGPRFLLLYLLSGVVGALLQTAFQTHPGIPNIGASGAIAGVLGAYLVIFPRVRIWQMFRLFRFRIGVLWFVILWLGWNLLGAFADQPGVGWMAHLGGFAAGAAFAYPYRVKPLAEVFQRPAES
jgi:membrane associated rhomboid family serine protease